MSCHEAHQQGSVDCMPIGEQDSQHQTIVAVDCEMCYTSKALELTRITLVGVDEQVYKMQSWAPCQSQLCCRTGSTRVLHGKNPGACYSERQQLIHSLFCAACNILHADILLTLCT